MVFKFIVKKSKMIDIPSYIERLEKTLVYKDDALAKAAVVIDHLRKDVLLFPFTVSLQLLRMTK